MLHLERYNGPTLNTKTENNKKTTPMMTSLLSDVKCLALRIIPGRFTKEL